MKTLHFVEVPRPVIDQFTLTGEGRTAAQFTITRNPETLDLALGGPSYRVQGQWLERNGTFGPTWGIEHKGRGRMLPNSRRSPEAARRAAERWYHS